ncbi:MAG: type II secretion system F family protein [Coriobacteriia bacterium]|nr:type II secretion system F family protein [Coriobacteriia bacterium]
MYYAIASLLFVSAGLFAWATLGSFFSDERAVRRRLEGLTAYEVTEAGLAHPQLIPFSVRVFSPGWARLRDGVASGTPAATRDRLRHALILAGNPRGMDVGRFLGMKVFSAVSVTALVLALAVVFRVSTFAWLLGAIISVASYWLPDLWLSSVTGRRQHQIRIELPDMLDMLTISVEAGLGFDQAIAKIVRMSHGPLAQEFARMLQEIQAGSSRSDALKRVTVRTDVPELNTFATAIIQAEQLGIPIANVLRVQSKEMRLVRRQRAEEQAQKTPVKIVFPLVLCILPATLIVILGPAIVSISKALF